MKASSIGYSLASQASDYAQSRRAMREFTVVPSKVTFC